jgi:hypothetical protein
MSTNQRTPASVAGIKRLAKKIASEKSVTHTAALEEAAKLAGYQNFIHAKRALSAAASQPRQEPPRVSNARKPEMQYSDFHIRARTKWTSTIDQFAGGNESRSWTSAADILRTLQPFMGSNANHAHLPTGGGFDFQSVGFSTERGCLDFYIGGRTFIAVKPKRLRLERIAADPAESFLLLELEDLDTTGVYDAERDAGNREYRQEEVVDLGGGDYVQRDGVDDGFYYDRDRRMHDLPDDYRIVSRLLNGQIMLVTKGSIWNGAPGTYSGTHDRYPAAEIRMAIERAISLRNAA